jgi:hypothetical protein
LVWHVVLEQAVVLAEVTVPVPDTATVSVLTAVPNVAVTLVAALIGTVQVVAKPLQAPPQPVS